MLNEHSETKITCATCKHFLGCGDWGLCCDLKDGLCYENTPKCDEYQPVED